MRAPPVTVLGPSPNTFHGVVSKIASPLMASQRDAAQHILRLRRNAAVRARADVEQQIAVHGHVVDQVVDDSRQSS